MPNATENNFLFLHCSHESHIWKRETQTQHNPNGYLVKENFFFSTFCRYICYSLHIILESKILRHVRILSFIFLKKIQRFKTLYLREELDWWGMAVLKVYLASIFSFYVQFFKISLFLVFSHIFNFF